MRDPLREIQQLQTWRGRKPADLSITRLVEVAADDATRTHRRLGEIIELWRELLPEAIVAHTALAGLRNSILQVKVDSASTAFEVDRLLRSGVEAELRRRFRGTLSRVKTRVEPLDAPASGEASAVKSKPRRGKMGASGGRGGRGANRTVAVRRARG